MLTIYISAYSSEFIRPFSKTEIKKIDAMKKITFNLILILLVVLSQPSFAALDSIFDQNVWRTFIVKLPNNYNSNNKYALVMNLHGLNSNAAQQQTYSQFDNVANVNNFIVVYPNAIAGSWNINGNIL